MQSDQHDKMALACQRKEAVTLQGSCATLQVCWFAIAISQCLRVNLLMLLKVKQKQQTASPNLGPQ
jgi:hypothetical protein